MKAEYTITYTFLLEAGSKKQLIINRNLLQSIITDARREADLSGYGFLLHGHESALKYEEESTCKCCGQVKK